MEHHFVVAYNSDTKRFYIDSETTNSRFGNDNVFNPISRDWESWEDHNDVDTWAMDKLQEALDKINE